MTQRKLICPDTSTAERLAGKLARHRPGREFRVYGLALGYQVVEVRRFAGFGYSWDGSRWVKQPRRPWILSPALPAAKVHAPPVTATVSLPLAQETKAYIGVTVEGALTWFGKVSLMSFEIAGDTVSMTLPLKYAQKRGLCA